MSAAGGGHRHFLPARSGDPQTSQLAPPEPDRFVSSGGKELFTNEDVIAGKGGFQKADLMNYGILYGMGSYCGEDYGASVLVRMASLTQNGIAQVRYGAAFSTLAADQQSAVIRSMRAQLQQVDLTRREVVAPDAIATLQQELESSLTTVNRAAGWTPASSLSSQDALHTALFGAFGLLALGLIIFLPALCRRRARGIQRARRPMGILAVQRGPGTVDRVQFLSDRLAAARRCVQARPGLRPQHRVLRQDPLLAMDATSR